MSAGESVVHIFHLDNDGPARLTPGVVPQLDGTVTYQTSVEARNDEKTR